MALTHILQPMQINKLWIKNRIIRTAHGSNFGAGSLGISDDDIAYHEARAQSGVALSILDCTSIHPSSVTYTVCNHDDSIIPGFTRLADMAHSHGMAMFVQLWHGGHRWGPLNGRAGWAPSTIPCPLGNVNTPFAMSKDQIGEIIEGFAKGALRVQQSGLDGVEIHFGHGYLIHEFLSSCMNRREDEYGGSFKNRLRFGREVLTAVRKAVGPDFPVGIRISEYGIEGGLTAEEAGDVVHALDEAKLIDYVDASKGSHNDYSSMVGTMDQPAGYMLPSADRILRKTSLPSIVLGRFRTLEEADQAIREGHGDMVSMVRAMIADPQLVSKTLAGHPEQVRPCIACNQGCIAGFRLPPHRMRCTVNPVVGYERTLGEHLIEPTSNPQKVVVVGGGPAGMEAARVAALSGHKVVLFEAQADLGGAVNIAMLAPKAQTLGDITHWLEQEVYRLGVDVRLGTYAEADEVQAEQPDVVIVATGSMPRDYAVQAARPGDPIPGVDRAHVVASREVFSMPPEKLGSSAVVFDDVGHYEAIAVAERLIDLGMKVTFVTRQSAFSPHMEIAGRSEPALRRLRKGDFRLHVRGRLVSVGENECELGYLEGDETWIVPADTVVLVTYNEPLNEVYRALGGDCRGEKAFKLFLVGDANSPRDMLVAIGEGHMAARLGRESLA